MINQDSYPNRETKEQALNTIGRLILHRATRREIETWLEIMIEHNAFQPYPQDETINKTIKHNFLHRKT